ncbi:MAG: pilin N-terminal domain-containing protein [Eubacteriales bacterium]|nr:pilin N-terminal domain-containing protein [Eubacteriales bacterium]
MKRKIGLILSLILMYLLGWAVMAATPKLEQRSDTLTIQCLARENAKADTQEMPLDGVELSLAKVADMTVSENGTLIITATPEYAAAGITYENMSASDSIKAAEKLAKLQTEGKLSADKKVTDDDGSITYADLTHGIYLVRQTGRRGRASNYTEYAPFLVMVPASEKDQWCYDTNAYPKTDIEKTTEDEQQTESETGSTTKPPSDKPSNNNPPGKTTPPGGGSVKTGDETPIFAWVIVLIVAVVILSAAMFLLLKTFKKRHFRK